MIAIPKTGRVPTRIFKTFTVRYRKLTNRIDLFQHPKSLKNIDVSDTSTGFVQKDCKSARELRLYL
jgi:hypothetical protein